MGVPTGSWAQQIIKAMRMARSHLGIEDVLIQRKDIIVREEKEQILQGLGQEERLHPILVYRRNLIHVSDSCVTSRRHLTVLLESLEDMPAPLPVTTRRQPGRI